MRYSSKCYSYYSPLSDSYRDSLTLDLGETFLELLVEVRIYEDLDYGLYSVYYPSEDGRYLMLLNSEINAKEVLNGSTVAYDFQGHLLYTASFEDGLKNGVVVHYKWQLGEGYLELARPVKIEFFEKGELYKSEYFD